MKRFKSNIWIFLFIIISHLLVIEGCQNNEKQNNIIENDQLVNLTESIFEIKTDKMTNQINNITVDEILFDNNSSIVDLSFFEGYKIVDSYYFENNNLIILENLTLNKVIVLQSDEEGYKIIFNNEGKIKKDINKPVFINGNNIVISLEDRITYLNYNNNTIEYINFKSKVDNYAMSREEEIISFSINNQVYIVNKKEIVKVNHPEDVQIEGLKWINESVIGKCLLIIYSQKDKKHLALSNINGNMIYESKENILDVGVGIDYIMYHFKDEDEITINQYVLSTNTEKKLYSNKDIKSILYKEDYFVVEHESVNGENFIRFFNFNLENNIKYITFTLNQSLERYDDCYYNANNHLITWLYHDENRLFLYKTNYDYTEVSTYIKPEDLFTIFTIEDGEVFGSKEFTNEDGSENFYYKDINSNTIIELGSLWGEGRGISTLPLVEKVNSNYVIFNHKEIKNCYTGKKINLGIDINEGNFNIQYLDAYNEKLAILISYEEQDLLKYNLYEYSFKTNKSILKDSFYFETWQHPWYDFKVQYNSKGELYYDSYDEIKKIPIIKKISLDGKIDTIIIEGTYCLLFNNDKYMTYYHIKDIGLSEYNLLQSKKINVDLENKKKVNVLEGTVYETDNYVLEFNYPNLSLFKKSNVLKKVSEYELIFNNDFRDGGKASNVIVDVKEYDGKIELSVIHKEWLGKEYKVEKYKINW